MPCSAAVRPTRLKPSQPNRPSRRREDNRQRNIQSNFTTISNKNRIQGPRTALRRPGHRRRSPCRPAGRGRREAGSNAEKRGERHGKVGAAICSEELCELLKEVVWGVEVSERGHSRVWGKCRAGRKAAFILSCRPLLTDAKRDCGESRGDISSYRLPFWDCTQ